MSGDNRALDLTEVQKLVSISKQNETHRQQIDKWPGEENLRLLAEAVNLHHHFVEFQNPYRRFIIRYENRYEAVFIKPEKAYIPCGWFKYQRLKEVLSEHSA